MADYPPAGAYPVGSIPGALQSGASNVGVFLADAIDPSTGDYRSISRGVDPIEAAALEALLVRRKSGSAVREDGMSFADLKKLDDTFESTLKAEIQYAWRRLIEARQIEFRSLSIETENDTATVKIYFVNLVQNQRGDLSIPLLKLQGAT